MRIVNEARRDSNLAKLPAFCYAINPNNTRVIEKIIRGMDGRWLMTACRSFEDASYLCQKWNQLVGVSDAQRAAMVCGERDGWDHHTADVAYHPAAVAMAS